MKTFDAIIAPDCHCQIVFSHSTSTCSIAEAGTLHFEVHFCCLEQVELRIEELHWRKMMQINDVNLLVQCPDLVMRLILG